MELKLEVHYLYVSPDLETGTWSSIHLGNTPCSSWDRSPSMSLNAPRFGFCVFIRSLNHLCLLKLVKDVWGQTCSWIISNKWSAQSCDLCKSKLGGFWQSSKSWVFKMWLAGPKENVLEMGIREWPAFSASYSYSYYRGPASSCFIYV